VIDTFADITHESSAEVDTTHAFTYEAPKCFNCGELEITLVFADDASTDLTDNVSIVESDVVVSSMVPVGTYTITLRIAYEEADCNVVEATQEFELEVTCSATIELTESTTTSATFDFGGSDDYVELAFDYSHYICEADPTYTIEDENGNQLTFVTGSMSQDTITFKIEPTLYSEVGTY
jgi:hypothetical protein